MAPVTFPSWYDKTKTLVDQEFVLKNFFDALLPDVNVMTWLPAGDVVLKDITQNDAKYLRIFRTGGYMVTADEKRKYADRGRHQFAAIAANRDQSWEIINFIRTVLWEYYLRSGRMEAAGVSAMVTTIGEVEGPQLEPQQFRDERLVPVTFDLDFEKPKGLPDYRIALGL